MTDPPSYKKISGLTYGTLTDEDRRKSRESYTWVDTSLSILLVVIIGAIYIFFS